MALQPEDVTIREVNYTPEIKPGGTVAVSFEVLINSGSTGVFDPDDCLVSTLFDGSSIIVEIELNGSVVYQEFNCHRDGDPDEPVIGFDISYSDSFTGPSQIGTYDLSAVVRRQSDGTEVARIDRSLSVNNDPVVSDCPPGFVRDPDTGNCIPSDNGDNGGGDDGPEQTLLDFLEDLPLILILVLLIVVAKLASDLFGE